MWRREDEGRHGEVSTLKLEFGGVFDVPPSPRRWASDNYALLSDIEPTQQMSSYAKPITTTYIVQPTTELHRLGQIFFNHLNFLKFDVNLHKILHLKYWEAIEKIKPLRRWIVTIETVICRYSQQRWKLFRKNFLSKSQCNFPY